MKIKHGFISNSSTTSFVILGVQVPYPENASDEELDEFYDNTIRVDDDLFIQGEKLTESEDWGLADNSMCLSELNDRAKMIAEKYGANITKIMLYMGTQQV